MTKRKHEQDSAKARVGRLAYQPPRLTEFGAVRDLTAAGTGARIEGGAKTSRRRRA